MFNTLVTDPTTKIDISYLASKIKNLTKQIWNSFLELSKNEKIFQDLPL